MSDFSLILLEAPLRPPGYDVQIGGHWPELVVLAVLLPVLIFVFMFALGMGPTWLRAARAPKGEVEAQ